MSDHRLPMSLHDYSVQPNGRLTCEQCQWSRSAFGVSLGRLIDLASEHTHEVYHPARRGKDPDDV